MPVQPIDHESMPLPDPYYQDDSITLYLASCYDNLYRLDWDDSYFVVTDPPYGTGSFVRKSGESGSGKTAKMTTTFEKHDWDTGGVTWMDSCLCDGMMIFWGAEFTLDLLARAKALGYDKHRQLFVRKPDPKPGLQGRIAWSMEPVWFVAKEGIQLYGRDDFFQGRMPRKGRDPEGVGHPYQKSIAMMMWLIGMLPERYTTIVDPFGGSGTTAVAAKMLGRKCILFEDVPAYADMQVERYGQGVIDLPDLEVSERVILPGFE